MIITFYKHRRAFALTFQKFRANVHVTIKLPTFNTIQCNTQKNCELFQLDRVKRIWYLSPMRTAKVQASLRIRAVSPEPSLLARTSSESRGTFRQKARSLAPLNGWACAVKICHDGMLEDTNSLDGAQLVFLTKQSGPQSWGWCILIWVLIYQREKKKKEDEKLFIKQAPFLFSACKPGTYTCARGQIRSWVSP